MSKPHGRNVFTARMTALRLLGVLVTLGIASCATRTDHNFPDAGSLVGTWIVDLRPKPDAPPYFKEFVVTSVSGNTFQGTFYDSPLSNGTINVDWGAVRLAFTTADNSGPYHHSGVLTGNRIEGLTNSTGRGFLAYWSATRSPGTRHE